MIEKIFGSARVGLFAALCVLFAQVGAADYSVQVTAGQDKDKGTVSVVKLPDDGSQPESSVNVSLSSEGESAVISAVPNKGYKFDQWTLTLITKDGGTNAGYLYDAEHTVAYTNYSSVAGLYAVQCLAAFSGKDIAVNLDANVASGHVSSNRVSCVFGEAYPALPTPTATGLKFLGWYDAPSDGSLVETGVTVVARSDEHTLYARWEPMRYTVTLDPGEEGRIESGSGTITVTYAAKYPTLPVPVRDRYDFVGWFTLPVNGKEVSAGDEVTITEDSTLYARWQIKESEIEYTVVLDGCGATKPGTTNVVLKKGAKIDGIVLPERTGYAFAGYWSQPDASGVCYVKPDGSPDSEWNDPAVTTVYAAWTPVDYTVSFKRGVVTAKGEMSDLTCVYDSTNNLPACAFANPLGTFLGWSRDPYAAVPEFFNEAVVSNLTTTAGAVVPLYAVWESELTDLSCAIDCDTLQLVSTGANCWTAYTNDAGEVSLMSGYYTKATPYSSLTTSVDGPGKLTFEWCVSGLKSPSNDVYVVIRKGIKIGGEPTQVATAATASQIETNVWYDMSFDVSAGCTIEWYSEARTTPDGGRLFLRDVKWLPDADPNDVYTVRFDPGEGSGLMTDVTNYVGVAAMLPSNAFTCADHSFDHWHNPLNNCDYPDGASVVDIAPGGSNTTLVAVWSSPPPPATNYWTVTPSIAGWTEGEEPSSPVAAAAFGEVVVTYSSGGATPPTAPGAYYATFAVAATEDWTGLSNNVAFTIAEYVPPPPPPPPPTISPLWPNDGPYDGSAARVYDGWALTPESNLVAVIQLKAAKLQTRNGVSSFTATATVKDEAAKSWNYSKGVGTADGDVTGLVCTARNVPVQSFDATLGADNLAGSWGGYEIFGARAGMGVKGDKMVDALEAYRGSWTLTLTNAAGTTRLQLVVGARGSTKISGDVAGGYKVNATVQSVMGEDGLYVPYLAVLKQGAFSLNASLLAKLSPLGTVEVVCSGFGPLVAGGRTTEDLGEISYPEETSPRAGDAFSAFASVNDLAYPVKFSAKGLPAGLKLNASSGEVSGTPTKPGVYQVVVTAVSGVNSKVKVERTLTITVDNFVDELIPVEDSYGPARVGVKFWLDLSAAAEGCSASGLPAGLKFATKATKDSVFGNVPAWTVYGVPTKPVTNAVVFKKSVKETVAGRTVTVTHVASSTLPVEGLDPWARGNFAGAAFADFGDEDPNGLLPSISVSASGKLSGKFIDAAGATWTLSAPAYDEYDSTNSSYSASVLLKNGKLVATNTIALTARDLDGEEYGVVSGSDPIWTAWQSPWANEPWKSVAKQLSRQQLDPVSDGAGGTITLKLAATGAVTAKLATTATNPRTGATISYSATCSSTLIPLGGDQYEVFVHFPPKETATVSFPGCSLAIPITP